MRKGERESSQIDLFKFVLLLYYLSLSLLILLFLFFSLSHTHHTIIERLKHKFSIASIFRFGSFIVARNLTLGIGGRRD